MTDHELMQQALSVLCNNVYPRDGVRDNRHLTPKSHADIYQQTIDALRGRVEQLKPLRPWVGLTKAEAKEISMAHRPYVIDMIAALEARLKEKNT